jgi:hypothetical protein
MSNVIPVIPNLTCPVPVANTDGYFTTEQSQLNITRKDKFRLVIHVPNILKPLLQKESRSCNGGNLDKLQITIWGFVVPEIQINTLEQSYAGQVLKFSGLSRPTYPPVEVNFTVDNKFDNYYILYKWLDIQNDETMSDFDGKGLNMSSTGSLVDYSSMFTIYALDEYDKPVAKWDYIGAFPTVLGSVEASYRETAELESRFSFVYSQIKMSLL